MLYLKINYSPKQIIMIILIYNYLSMYKDILRFILNYKNNTKSFLEEIIIHNTELNEIIIQ